MSLEEEKYTRRTSAELWVVSTTDPRQKEESKSGRWSKNTCSDDREHWGRKDKIRGRIRSLIAWHTGTVSQRISLKANKSSHRSTHVFKSTKVNSNEGKILSWNLVWRGGGENNDFIA